MATRDMNWAVGTIAAFVVTLAVGGAAATAGLFAEEPTPTPAQTPAPPTASATPSPTGSPTPSATPSQTSTAAASPTTAPQSTSTVTITPVPLTPTVTRTPTAVVRRMTSNELSLLLTAHVESQRAQFQEGRVRFTPPDRVVITGRSASVPVEVTLQVGVDGNARPKILAYRITSNGQPAAPQLQAALAARVTQTNSEVDLAVPRNQRVRRVYVTADAILGEFE